jgi:hypothetical protein
MEEEIKWLISNNGALVLEFLNSSAEEPINPVEVVRWIRYYLRGVQVPTNWKLTLPLADIAYEQTTIVYCQVHGDETLDSPVDFAFTKEPQTLCHLLFVCEYENNYAVIGSLLSSTFFSLLDSGAFVSYNDIMKRETAQLFDGIAAFEDVDYYFVFDKIHEESPPLIDELCKALFTKFCKIAHQRGFPSIPQVLQPYVFQYMLFAMSASDILADAFISYEKKKFEKRLIALRHNPYLQFELCRKWLRIDWRPTRLTEFSTSQSEELAEGSEIAVLHACTRSHFPSALANPSHCVPVRLHYFMPAHPNLKCVICSQIGCVARPPMQDGHVLMPLQLLPFAAIEALGILMRKWIQTTRRDYHTHDALTLWVQDASHKDWKLWTSDVEHSEEEVNEWGTILLRKITHNPKDPVVPEGVRTHVRNALTTRDNFVLLFDRDPLILERVIIGKIWASQCGLLPDFPVLKPAEKSKGSPKPLEKYDAYEPGVILDKEAYSNILTHEQLLAYTSVYWPPCMHRLIEVAVGKKHLRYEKRLILGRFLLSSHLHYTMEEARRFWSIVWSASDIYKKSYESVEAFWGGEYGVCFENFIHDPYEKKLWPYCKTMAKLDLCAFIDDVEADIEDIFGKAQERCTRELLAHRRMKLQKKPNSGVWKLYFPAAFTRNLHTFN